MAYNIIKGRVEFSNSTTGSVESLVDIWRNQSIGGTKTFTSNITASGYWDSTRNAKLEPLSTLISGDGADRVITSDGDGTLTAESNVTITTAASITSFNVSGPITGSTFSGSARGLTNIILDADHLASTDDSGRANKLSASFISLGIGMSSSVENTELQVTGGTGIIVDGQGVQVLTASNGGLKFTGQTLQVDAASTTNKGGGPSNSDEFIIADSSDSDSIKNLTYSQIKTAITDSISVPITTYNNSGDNRIITSVNSTTVNGEANLSFDGSILQMTGTLGVSGSKAIKDDSVPAFRVSVGSNNVLAPDHVSINMGVEARLKGNLAVSNYEGGARAGIYISKTGSSYLVDGDDIGLISFNTRGDTTRTGTHSKETSPVAAQIFVEADGSEHNGTSKPGRMSFWTCPSGTINPVERMTINNSGNIGIGTTTIPHTLTVAGTVSASLGVSALSFTGDGSGLTGVTGEWDGSHVGNSSITGSLYLTDALSASSGITGSSFVSLAEDGATSDRKVIIINGQISASHTVTATSFAGDGSGLTGVSAPGILTAINASNAYTTSSLAIGGNTTPDHKIAVSGAISASLNVSASGFYAQGVTANDGAVTATSLTTSTLSASSTVNLVGPINLGRGNQTTVSNIGIISSSAAHTVYKSTLDRIIVGNATISDGLIDGTTIGNNAQSSGKFTTLSASGQTDLVGTTRFGYDNYTTISLAGVISSSATATINNATLDRITVGDATIKNGQISGSLSGSGLLNSIHKLSLDRLSVGAVVGDLSASLGLSGKGVVVDDGGTIGPAADIDLMTLTADTVTVAGAVNSTTLSASSTVNLVGPTNFGKENQTTVSNVGVLSSSATATFANATLDQITIGSADINGGNVDGAVIGASDPAAGTFLTVSASSTLQAMGVVTVGNGKTTVSAEGVLSSSATATLHNIQTNRATFQEINTTPAGNGTVELIGGINTTGHISSSLGVHVTGSEASVAIGDHKGTGMVGMLAIRPSGDLEEAENNKIHILCQRSEASDNRVVFAVSGSGKVAVGGGHLDGVLNVSGSGVEKLISAKSDLHNPAFYLSGSGEVFIKGDTINSGSFTSSGSVRAPLLRETIHTYAPGDTNASYIRFYESGRNTSFDKKVIMVKPYLGNLDKIIARGTSAAGSTAISFHKAGDGSATPNGSAIETVTVDMSSANTSYTFIFDPGTSKFAAGDVVSVKVDPSSDPGDITLTCVWEYDTRTT